MPATSGRRWPPGAPIASLRIGEYGFRAGSDPARTNAGATNIPRSFLFLQGPITPFFSEIGARLRALGHDVHRINLNLGDRLFWRGPGAVNFRGRPEAWPDFIAAFLDRHGVTDLLLLGEQRAYHRAAIAAARARGIQVVATDFGYFRPDWIVLERDGLNRESHFPRDPAAILALAADLPPPDFATLYRDSFRNQAVMDVTYHLASLLPGFFPHYRSHQLYHPIQTYLGTLIRILSRPAAGRRAGRIMREVTGKGVLYLLAMQMETDFSVRAYSPYPDMDTMLREVIDSFARHAPADARLLVKVHPLDPGIKHWHRRVNRIARGAGILDRVHYLGGGNLGDMVEQVQGLVTINSTVGLRAVIDHLPTHALGDAIYKIPGLVHLGPLDAFWTEGQPPDPKLREAFLRGIAHCLHVRGTYYNRPGLDAAVAATVHRLQEGLINRPVVEPPGAPPAGS